MVSDQPTDLMSLRRSLGPVTLWSINAIKIFAVIACLYAAYVAGKWGLADLYFVRAYDLMNKWTGQPTAGEWNDALGEMQRAVAWDKSNPDYNDGLARLCYLGTLVIPSEREKYGGCAETAFEASISARPTWPSAWAGLAYVKAALGESDARLERAVLEATQLGAWDPEVHRLVAVVGTLGLDGLPPKVQSAIIDNDVRGIAGPEIGRAMEVVDALEGYAPSDLRLVMVEAAAEMQAMAWVDDRGMRRYKTFSRVSIEFWTYFTPSQRELFLDRAVQNMGLSPVLSLARKHHRLADVCPLVARQEGAARFCGK